ncbi:hypothetical protein LINGRAHAP2_LOCUS1677 [Linum grandiflorum]
MRRPPQLAISIPYCDVSGEYIDATGHEELKQKETNLSFKEFQPTSIGQNKVFLYWLVAQQLYMEGDSSASYIHMVQHLIEKCLIFHMSKEECMEALSKHANIKPVITSTVWKELEKENKGFFEAYAESKSKDGRMSEEETSAMIRKMISTESSKNDSED